MMAPPDTLPLATLEICFKLLYREPGVLTLDGHLLANGLRPRTMSLDELRGCIDHLSQEVRHGVLAVLVAHAQAGSPAWQVGLAGLLLPGLQQLADQSRRTDRAGAEADVLRWYRSTLGLPAPDAVRSLHWLLRLGCANSGSALTKWTAVATA
jgi:hypothetical protein